MEKSGILHESGRVEEFVISQGRRAAPGDSFLRQRGSGLPVGPVLAFRSPPFLLWGRRFLMGLSPRQIPCRASGFTLFELCLAVAIAVMVLGLAVPSLRGVFADQKRNAVFEQFDDLVRRAQRLTVEERKGCRLVWWRDAVVLVAEGVGAEPNSAGLGGGLGAFGEAAESVGEASRELGRVGIGRGEVYGLERPHALLEKPPMEWPFWVGGTCEPVVVSYQGPAGRWKAVYDGLTGRGKLVGEELK